MSRRHDVQDATGRLEYLAGRGTLQALPTQVGSCDMTTGIPTNGTTGFAPGCIWHNFKATSPGTMFYVNVGTFTSSIWANIDAVTYLSTATGLELTRVADVSTRLITAITTLTVTEAAHESRTILLSLLAGFATTLPAATGGGAIYKFKVGIVVTSGSYTISTAPSTDIFQGSVVVGLDNSTSGKEFITGATSNTITLNGTGAGATIGDEFTIQDIKAGVWSVTGILTSTGSPATPFSHV